MACIGTMTIDQSLPCGMPPAAPLARPVSAKIINEASIASYTISGPPEFAKITRASGTPAAASVETANGALKITMGLKGGELYPQMLDPTFEMTFFATDFVSNSLGATRVMGMNAQIVLAVDHGSGNYRVYGLGYPLVCLSIGGDTDGNGYIRTTFGVEDWQPGTTVYRITEADYVALSTAAV